MPEPRGDEVKKNLPAIRVEEDRLVIEGEIIIPGPPGQPEAVNVILPPPLRDNNIILPPQIVEPRWIPEDVIGVAPYYQEVRARRWECNCPWCRESREFFPPRYSPPVEIYDSPRWQLRPMNVVLRDIAWPREIER